MIAQEDPTLTLEIRIKQGSAEQWERVAVDFRKEFPNEQLIIKELSKIRIELVGKSYLGASFDEIIPKGKKRIAVLDLGPSYKWAKLKNGNVDQNFLEKIGFREKLFENRPIHYSELQEIQKKLLEHAENNGYPFAIVGLDSLNIKKDGSISARLMMDKKQYITFKDIEIFGEDVKISPSYLMRYLGIKPGEPYSNKTVLEIPKRIRELAFLREVKTPLVSFRGKAAIVNLFLRKKNASKFDFLVGVLPRDAQTGSRLLITVDGMFSTQNLLGAGERLHVEFRQLQPGTQRLDLNFGYPYLLGLPFGVEGDFELYKRDSSYLDLEYDAGISYSFSARNSITAFWHGKLTNLISVNETQIVNLKKLPTTLDTRFTDFGLKYNYENLDYRFNPRKGWRLETRASAGFKKIIVNNQIEELEDPADPTFNFKTLYDSLDLRTFQYQIENKIGVYIPVFPKDRGVVHIANRTGSIVSQGPVYVNEQYRIGGNKFFRGFDEESILNSTHSIFTFEYRFLLGTNSFIYLFGDTGFIQSKAPEQTTNDWPIGFGAGMTFETKIGLFGISYAYGRQNGNPIDFRAAKIHFGYVNYF